MKEIKSTTDYGIFKFRKDNRAVINQTHVQRIAESIKTRNFLDMRPICINADMEIIDGQNRLLAAQMLGVPIYYYQDANLKGEDIILMNVAKSWIMIDYLNFYCKNNYPEYIKLDKFMKKHSLSLHVALRISIGKKADKVESFKSGKFVFDEQGIDDDLDICWETIDYIIKIKGQSQFTSSSKFWAALLMMINHESFDRAKWKGNLIKMIDRVTPRVTQNEYLKMFMEIHNWRNMKKVELL